MKDYEPIEHTADIGIRVFGKDLKELFENAAKGMSDIMAGLDSIEKRDTVNIDISSDSKEELIVDFLNEFLYFFDTQGFLLASVDINQIDQRHLKARAFGEFFDENKHEVSEAIKAVTYHMLKVGKTGDEWEAQIIFDV